MLHLVFNLSDASIFTRLYNQHSIIVFLDNSVLTLLEQSIFKDKLLGLIQLVPCYVLYDDLVLRGILQDKLIKGVACINNAELVKMTIEHTSIYSWN
jgi:sulfur relay protein TusB/DsrH